MTGLPATQCLGLWIGLRGCALLVLTAIGASGCTWQDTAAITDGLMTGSRAQSSFTLKALPRWQLPHDVPLYLESANAAPGDMWVEGAQAGLSSYATPIAQGAHRLRVWWPAAEAVPPREAWLRQVNINLLGVRKLPQTTAPRVIRLHLYDAQGELIGTPEMILRARMGAEVSRALIARAFTALAQGFYQQ